MMPAELEANAVNDAYTRAVAAYGARVAVDTLAVWEAVSGSTAVGQALLVAQLTRLSLAGRVALATLAVRRAQLVRALRVGQRLEGPDDTKTLQDLRDAFNESLAECQVPRAKYAKSLDASHVISVDHSSPSLGDVIAEVNHAVDDELKGTIHNLGKRRLAKIAFEQGVVTPDDVSTSRNLVAMGVERVTLNGGRETDAKILPFDRKAIGYIRVHNHHSSDNPCSFCAMLLSRGAAYKTPSSGTYTEGSDGLEKYHGGCHCTAEAVYSRRDYLTNPRYELNRALQDEWTNNVTGSGFEAEQQWRQHMKTYFNAGRKKTAQAAA